ncbi:MAG: 16S rRNA (cytidine(1402)-2'-O)-methyltransferase [Spirochaetales bacterium]|nr:16S rRNA (cytidine(1402)-2'-O)-methyltransferase [Spirochaetales bacterium]
MTQGILYLVATPIGNLEDITFRALRVLGEADVLACEDTRHTQKLFQRHGIARNGPLVPYHEHNELRAAGVLLGHLEKGKTVALVSNAGSPGISDPGYRIITAAISGGHRVEAVPGPNAPVTALLVSGLPSSSYTFKGFPPKKKGPRKRFLEMEKQLPHTLIFFESPYRIASFLHDAYEVYGNRMASVCIELTKKFERVHRGYLGELREEFSGKKTKGEITVVIAGNNPKFTGNAESDAVYPADTAL